MKSGIKPNQPDIQLFLQQISDILIINGGFLSNPGLYSGEMGIILFFTRYSRYTQNPLYLEYAYDLMEKVQNRIHLRTPINYKQGLAGIGSAIEYLVQNGFFEADTDEILEDFDRQLFIRTRLPDLSPDVILDIAYYVIWRISGNSSHKDRLQFTILPQIIKILESWSKSHDLSHIPDSFLRDIISSEKPFISHDSVIPEWHSLCLHTIPDGYWEKVNIHYSKLFSSNTLFDINNPGPGLQNGLAGWGISLLTQLDGDNSWISLLPNDFYNEPLPV